MITEFIDQTTPQVFVLKFLDESEGVNVLTSTNGDFTTDLIEINRPFMTGLDFAAGEVPSASLSCTLQNEDSRFSGFPFGEAYSFIGYKDSVSNVPIFTVNGHTIDLNGLSDIKVDGTTILGTQNVQSAVVSEKSQYGDGYLYFVDYYGDLIRLDLDDLSETTLGGISPFFQNLVDAHENRITYIQYAVEYGNPTMYAEWEDGVQTDYVLVPTGVYNIQRPRSTSTLTIDIINAFDRSRQFDISCGSFVADEKIKYPTLRCTAGDFIGDIMDLFGFDYYVSTAAAATTIRLDWLTNEAYTYRQLLKYASEACASNLYCGPCGEYDNYTVGVTATFGQFPDTMIAANGYDRADFETKDVRGVELYKADNTTWFSGSTIPGTNNYVIENNPLVDEDALQDCNFVNVVTQDYPEYHPVTVDVTELDPSIFRAANSTVDIMNIYTGSYETVPIWEVNIYWCGKTYGSIISGGEEYRMRNEL